MRVRASELILQKVHKYHPRQILRCINVPYVELRSLLSGAVAGLHSMVDEHFGICVVEYMAAGVVPIAHNSGGPAADIVVPISNGSQTPGSRRTGFLATTVEEYSSAITAVLSMPAGELLDIASAARQQASKFSTRRFMDAFTAVVQPILPQI